MGKRLIPSLPFKWRLDVRSFVRRRAEKAGLPPGSLVYVGEEPPGATRISLLQYDETQLREEEAATVEACSALKEGPAVAWVTISGLHDVDTVRQIGECFGLHPLVMEDVLDTQQRPKIEDHGDKLYIVFRALRYDTEARHLVSEQISLVLGRTFLLCFQERDSGLFDSVKERLRDDRGRMRGNGPDYLAHAILDVAVDTYLVALEAMEDQIDVLEAAVVSDPRPATLRAIQDLKRDTLLMRKALWPLREVAGRLGRGDSPLIQEGTLIYFRDFYDHTVQAVDILESFRDIVDGMREIYLSSISNNMNAVMKVLTLVATIFLPLTLIAGIYGMNFRYMPELQVHWGYYGVWGAMVVIGVGMLLYFKLKRWL